MGTIIVLAVVMAGLKADRVALTEEVKPGSTTRVSIEFKAEGTFKPAAIPGSPEPKPLALKVETKLVFIDRVASIDSRTQARKSVRQVEQAAATINGEVRPSSATLRPEVALLVAEKQETAIKVASPGGPLTRSELELVQQPGDPLALASLMSNKPVAVGDHWIVGDLAARDLSGYDALAANSLEATLEAIDENSARVRLLGTIRGAALGGEGSMACDGSLTFDRKARRVARLTLKRAETRRPGAVEDGLDVKSIISVSRTEAEAPKPLDDDAFVARAIEPSAGLDLLLFEAPSGKAMLLHDRDWHVYWDDARQAVLKRLDRGEMVAQLNLSVGPNAGKGRHQNLDQFRDDIQRVLGDRFVKFIAQGEVEGAPAGGFRYKVTVQGRQGDAGVLWHYYLLAGPEGDQLIATFTLGLAQQAQFGDQDLRLIGTLEWKQ
jgi:hypothetical protein